MPALISYTQPLLLVFLVIGFSGLLRRRLSTRTQRILLAAGLGGIFLISWPPVEWLLALPLELPYRRVVMPEAPADAIVVLAGSGDPAHVELPVHIPGPDSYARCRYAAWLHQNWRPVPVVVSGGTHNPKRPPIATVMAGVLRVEGVPNDLIVEESRSRNTRENAAYTAALLRQKGIRQIALVVDAASMLRAELCFRKEGISVVPVPMGQRSGSFPTDLLPSAASIRGNEVTLHESLGLVWYKLRRWI
jgi:uncharacterized SAM-binding protein YcdF (DUF218 family)